MQGDPIDLNALKKTMEEISAQRLALFAGRIDCLVAEHGSLRKAGKAIGVDYAYLHRLRKGTKTDPGESVLKRLGLM